MGYLSALRCMEMKLSGLLDGKTASASARWLASQFASVSLWQRQTCTPYSFGHNSAHIDSVLVC